MVLLTHGGRGAAFPSLTYWQLEHIHHWCDSHHYPKNNYECCPCALQGNLKGFNKGIPIGQTKLIVAKCSNRKVLDAHREATEFGQMQILYSQDT